VSRRHFDEAARLLCDSLPTFSETSLMSFQECVRCAVICAALTFDRPTLLKKVIRSPEVLEVVKDIHPIEPFLSSLYNCRYGEFFAALSELEAIISADYLLAPHTHYIIKEMRIRAYSQLLTAYRSIRLSEMAKAFVVSEDVIDQYDDLCHSLSHLGNYRDLFPRAV
jgi:26S proteasome regulatory subunit N7